MKHTINCSKDLDSAELDSLIAQYPELLVLRDLGEIIVEVEGTVKGSKDSFSAHNLAGDLVKFNTEGHEVSDLEVTWYPDESDIEHAEECDVDSKVLTLFKNKVLAEPKNLKYELLNVLTGDATQEIEDKYIEENRD